MKTLKLLCAAIALLFSISATAFTISGHVQDLNGNAASNVFITITGDSSSFVPYSASTQTDAAGNYSHTVNPIPNGQVGYTVSAMDSCGTTGTINWQIATVWAFPGANGAIADFTVNLCGNSGGGGGGSGSCTAWFGPIQGTNCNEFTFDVANYTPGMSWFMDFGDGNSTAGYGAMNFINHTYQLSQTASVNVCFTVSDSASGCSDAYCEVISVCGSGVGTNCQASFYTLNSQLQQNTMLLVNTSTVTNPNATSYFWDFGDGNTSTQQYPVHQYAQNGPYTVCLTISDMASGCSSTFCDSIVYIQKTTGFNLNVIDPNQVGLDEINEINEVTVFPNPVKDDLTINYSLENSKAIAAMLLDVTGKVIYTETYTGVSGLNTEQIDMSEYNTGLYFLQLSVGNQKVTKKIVK